jgi:hypothetical protein
LLIFVCSHQIEAWAIVTSYSLYFAQFVFYRVLQQTNNRLWIYAIIGLTQAPAGLLAWLLGWVEQ